MREKETHLGTASVRSSGIITTALISARNLKMKLKIHKCMTKKEKAKRKEMGSWSDEVYQLDPFLSIKDSGGSNGEDDVKFSRMLHSDRFVLDLPDSTDLPKAHDHVYVIERIFLENYENVFIQWVVKMADNSVQQPYKFIALHETDHDVRR